MKLLSLINTMLLILLIGCSVISGTGGTIDPTIPSKNQKIFSGEISKVDSEAKQITVNGVTFIHTGAQIIRNSNVANTTSLKPGQIVTLQAKDNDDDGIFEAIIINVEEQLSGPIDSIDLNAKTLQLCGQTVSIANTTIFSGASIDSLTANNYIAVFGLRREDGSLEATLIEFKKSSFSYESDYLRISGEVTDIRSNTIIIDGVEVYVKANEFNEIKVGQFIHLNSSTSTILPTSYSDTTFDVDSHSFEKDNAIVLEGIPRKITSRNVFFLNGIQIFVPIALMDKANIESVKDMELIIEGVFISENEIVASSIYVELDEDVEISGDLQASVDQSSITVDGQKVLIDQYTLIDFDLTNVLSEIKSGLATYVVFVEGNKNTDGILTASFLSLTPKDHDKLKNKRLIKK